MMKGLWALLFFMPHNLYLYTTLPVPQLDTIVESHKERFDNILNDTFSDVEFEKYEKIIDGIAAIYVQPILSELSFDDFYASADEEDLQRSFFKRCKSSIGLENLPFLESNPVQVSYLLELLELFDEVLIDRGGIQELSFKDNFLKEISRYKTIDSLVVSFEKPLEVKTTRPVDPIDFLILDVYTELDRLKGASLDSGDLSPKVQTIFHVMRASKLDSTQLLRAIGLNPKDFDDGLERLKFWLRKQ
jgi:hypothetical protein